MKYFQEEGALPTPGPVIILPRRGSTESWMLVARQAGHYLPLYPRKFPRLFTSRDEAVAAARDRLIRDRAFRLRFAGWWIEPVCVSDGMSYQEPVGKIMYAWESEGLVG